MSESRLFSLRTRLSVAIALILLSVLLLAFALMVSNARRAVADEAGAVLALGVHTLDLLAAGAPPTRAVALEALAGLDEARHLCVSTDDGSPPCPRLMAAPVPAWFAAWASAAPRSVERQLRLDDGTALAARLSTEPADEMLEAWNDARGLLLALVLSAVLTNFVVFAIVGRQLRPVSRIVAGLEALGRGESGQRVAVDGADELAVIAEGVNRLADRLESTSASRRLLLRRKLDIQEAERRHIARELHDDFGQYLSAMQADVAVLSRRVDRRDTAVMASLRALQADIGVLSTLVRDMLRRLRPTSAETGDLRAGLSGLVAEVQSRHPGTRYLFRCHAEVADLTDARAQLHVYRIVQEALTNAARHAQARRVLVWLQRHDRALRILVIDDGLGIDTRRPHPGLGLRHLEERALAVCGELSVRRRSHVGTCVELRLPV